MSDLAEKRNSELSEDVIDLSTYSGFGVENATAEDMAIPFLVILQALSPQVTNGSPKYMEDAKIGMIMNTVTGELYDGKEGIVVYHVAFKKNLVEWTPRSEGGGLIGIHEYGSDVDRNAKPHPEKKFLRISEAGGELIDTRYHYIIMVTQNGWEPAVITMTSTQVKYSRRWVSALNTTKIEHKGKKIIAPAWMFPYRITSMPDSNKKGSYMSWKIVREPQESVNWDLFRVCADFHESVKKGEAKTQDLDHELHSGKMESEDIPF